MKIKQLATLVIGVLLFGMVSCEYATIEPEVIVIPDTDVLWATQVAPIFTQAACNGCHGSGSTPDFSSPAKAYTSLTTKNLVNTASPATSPLVVKIKADHPAPNALTATQLALLLKWIEQGAKNN